MNRTIWVFLVFCGLLVIPCLVLGGSSRHTFFPSTKQLKILRKEPQTVVFRFTAHLDGMEKIHLRLPALLKRRPVDLVLQDARGKEVAKLYVHEKDRFRSERTFAFDHRIDSSRERDFRLCMTFTDGPVLEKDGRKSRTFQKLSITICYEIDLIQVLMNYQKFKPFGYPLLATGLFFLLYLLVLIPLLRRLFPPALDSSGLAEEG